uniref:Uncharacterized protein n=1 Tax=Zea mays TaxID=4577 RepID=C0PKX0_MAIZE|nr:unknown [Zea mays]
MHAFVPCRVRAYVISYVNSYERVTAGSCLRAQVALGHALATVVDEGAELDGDIDDDAEHAGLDGRAEADGGLEVRKAFDEGTAWLGRHLASLAFDEAEHIGAHAELERVQRALAAGRRGWGSSRRRRRWLDRGRWGRAVAAGVGHREEQEVESQEEDGLGCHGSQAGLT